MYLYALSLSLYMISIRYGSVFLLGTEAWPYLVLLPEHKVLSHDGFDGRVGPQVAVQHLVLELLTVLQININIRSYVFLD